MVIEKVNQFWPIGFLLLTDLALVLVHLLWGQSNMLFHLDAEQNLPTYYQGIKAILTGVLCLLLVVRSRPVKKVVINLSIVSFGLIYLGLDESLMIHENVELMIRKYLPQQMAQIEHIISTIGYRSSIWLFLLSPFLVLAGVYGLYLLRYISKQTRRQRVLLYLSAVLMLGVLFLEYLGSRGIYSPQTYQWLMIMEEMSEMFSISLIISFILSLHSKLSPSSASQSHRPPFRLAFRSRFISKS